MNKHAIYDRFALHKIRIPLYVLNESQTNLKNHGSQGHEGMVLWTGVKSDHEAIVRSCIHPRQICTAVSYDIPLDESQALNIILANKKEVILAQVHSHPGAAFHSSRDDAMPFTYTVGFFSLVIPNFCNGNIENLSDIRIWEHMGFGTWRELSQSDIAARFHLSRTV